MAMQRKALMDLHRRRRRCEANATLVSDVYESNLLPQKLPRSVCNPTVFSGTRGQSDYEEFANIWDALGFAAEESAKLEARSTRMMQIREIIRSNKWTPAVAAKRCGVSQPRTINLVDGRIDQFSLAALVNMAAALGQRAIVTLEAA